MFAYDNVLPVAMQEAKTGVLVVLVNGGLIVRVFIMVMAALLTPGSS